MASGQTRTIHVEALARVEGEGAVHVSVDGGRVTDVRLEIFEPPRFFEALLRGRSYLEVADLVARICGICPVAYQMSAIHALESILGVTPPPEVRELRRLFYCGEWIESHVLHVALLAAPDAFGLPSVVELAVARRADVERAFALRRVGNRVLELLGGRAIHPVSARPGGFTRVPSRAEMTALATELERAREQARELLAWIGTFERRPRPLAVERVSLRHPREYPLNEGRIVSTAGLDVAVDEWERVFEEIQVPHSTALHARLRGRGGYLVGPIARLALNLDLVGDELAATARSLGFDPLRADPAQGVIARGVETAYAIDEALRIARSYVPPEQPHVPTEPRAGVGFGATEAPRGTLFHRFELDERGLVVSARIVPPTSQNQATIEDDLRALAPRIVDLPLAEATHACEVAIRDYDPCISCATHFVKLSVERVTGAAPQERGGPPASAAKPARVLCVGSASAADRLGLDVADRLARGPAAARGALEVVAVTAPAMDLAARLAGAERVVVVDAVHGEPAGELVTGPLRELRGSGTGSPAWSSHGLGVGASVRLAEALGGLAAHACFVGVRVGSGGADETTMAAWAELAAGAVEALVAPGDGCP